jgi:uncharacterized Zn finger protein
MRTMDDDFYDEDLDDDEVIENAVLCPTCEDVTGHQILKEKEIGRGKDYLLRCESCSTVHEIQFRAPPLKRVPFMLTDGPKSYMATIDLDSDEWLELDDVFEHDEMAWRITRLESEKGSVDEIEAVNLVRAVALRQDMLRVKITKTRGEFSTPDVLIVEEGTTFKAGTIFDIGVQTWRIRAIHTGEGRTLRGTVDASKIKRMYLHEPPRPERFEPKTPRERRQAWKEGRLGFNPNPILPKEHIKKRVKPTNKRKKKKARK